MPKISKLLKMLDIFYSKMILSFDIGTTNIKALLYQGENVIRRYEVGIKTTNNTQNPNEILSIVKEIINAHNENINVISTEGVGTEFIFSLQPAKSNEEED